MDYQQYRLIEKTAGRYSREDRRVLRRDEYYDKRMPEIRSAQVGALVGGSAIGTNLYKKSPLKNFITKKNVKAIGGGALKASAAGAGLAWVFSPMYTAYKAKKIREKNRKD